MAHPSLCLLLVLLSSVASATTTDAAFATPNIRWHSKKFGTAWFKEKDVAARDFLREKLWRVWRGNPATNLWRRQSFGVAAGGCQPSRPLIYDGFFQIYDGFFHGNQDLTLDGEASLVDGLLRLTQGTDLKGHAFYAYPLNFTSFPIVPSFSTTLVFSIIGSYLDISTDGLAFVLSPTKDFSNASAARYMGFLDAQNHFLAVEFDTVLNTDFRDIDSNHVGIDFNGLFSSVRASPAGYYKDNPYTTYNALSLDSGQPIQVWVDYNSTSAQLDVTIAPCCLSPTKPSLPMLAVPYNLSSVLTPTSDSPVLFAGFSAGTGRLKTQHYILGWSFKINGEAAALNYTALSLNTIQDLARQLRSRPLSHNTMLCAVLVPTLAISILVASAALVKVYMKRQSKARKNKLEWEREYGPPSFTYKDLLTATDGFKDKLLLGKGGFGSVFRGVLPHSKQTVAIKRVSPESKQGMKEFMAEIVILGHIRHRNLVQLLGYCRHKQQLLLVYDYMPNRSLDCFLHGQEIITDSSLCWAQRFHIIKGVASGLLYLHEEWEQVIIHRDIKSSNVLLDAEMNARLGDFGLARSHDHGADAYTTRMAGTWGYIAPELARLGKATKATDVFALGVLMMEVVCARRPILVDAADGEPVALADWVLAAWRADSITNAFDPMLPVEEAAAELVLKLGLLCSHPLPSARPCMRLVMQYLQRDAPLPADLQPDNLLLSSYVLTQEEDQNDVSYPLTTITDLSKGR
ncbi:hypothetical protein EJB05_14345, partial [Eragrostis curvula]